MNIVHKINLNWNPDNPKLKCKKDYFTDGLFFEVGKEYQIYRIVYYEYEDKKRSIYHLFNDKRICSFINSTDEYDPFENVYDYFENVDRVLRKIKLDRINNISQ